MWRVNSRGTCCQPIPSCTINSCCARTLQVCHPPRDRLISHDVVAQPTKRMALIAHPTRPPPVPDVRTSHLVLCFCLHRQLWRPTPGQQGPPGGHQHCHHRSQRCGRLLGRWLRHPHRLRKGGSCGSIFPFVYAAQRVQGIICDSHRLRKGGSCSSRCTHCLRCPGESRLKAQSSCAPASVCWSGTTLFECVREMRVCVPSCRHPPLPLFHTSRPAHTIHRTLARWLHLTHAPWFPTSQGIVDLIVLRTCLCACASALNPACPAPAFPPCSTPIPRGVVHQILQHGRVIRSALLSTTSRLAEQTLLQPLHASQGIVDQLLQHGRVIRPALGISIASLPFARGSAREGVLVVNVRPGGPADVAGIQPTRR